MCLQLLHLILLHAGVMSMGLLSTAPPVVWEFVCLSSEAASPEADVASEDTKEVSLSLPPSPSALAWQWLKAPELETSSDILSSVDMFIGPCRGGQSGSYKTRQGKQEAVRHNIEILSSSKQMEVLQKCHCNRRTVGSSFL